MRHAASLQVLIKGVLAHTEQVSDPADGQVSRLALLDLDGDVHII